MTARFGKPGASAVVARSPSPCSAKGGTADSPPYGSFFDFRDFGSDMRGVRRGRAQNDMAAGVDWTGGGEEDLYVSYTPNGFNGGDGSGGGVDVSIDAGDRASAALAVGEAAAAVVWDGLSSS